MPIMQSPAANIAPRPDTALHCARTVSAQGLRAELAAGAAQHIARARALRGRDAARQARFIGGAVGLLESLRATLDLAGGDTMAVHLDDVCGYMSAQLRRARAEGAMQPLDEINDLLNEVRMAWFS